MDDTSKIGKLDQAVRPLLILLFSGALVYGFLFGKLSADSFVPIALIGVNWLFAQRKVQNGANGSNGSNGSPAPATPTNGGTS